MENIHESDNDEDGDGIGEDIVVEEADSSKGSQSDDIKESLHPVVEDSHLTGVRRAMGSEEAIRKQSKHALNNNNKKSSSSSGPFDKNSYNQFAEEKFKQYLSDSSGQILDQFEKQLEIFKINAQLELESDLNRNLITPRTHRRKGEELEKWASNKRQELQKKVEPLNQQVKSIMNSLKKEKKIIMEKIGLSPRSIERKSSLKRQIEERSSSLDYDEMDELQDEGSDESMRTKNARDQIHKLAKGSAFEDFEASESGVKDDYKIKKKKAIAKKLIIEKEKVIKDGLKQRLRQIEADQADKMIAVALKLDPQQEIEKRIREMERAIEESSDGNQTNIQESARSVISISQSGVPSESIKSKKKVKFESPNKFRSSNNGSVDGSSIKNSSHKFEESIGESIDIGDSIQQSMPSVIIEKPGSNNKKPSSTHSI